MNALCNLDGLHTSITHLYTLSTFFMYFEYEFPLFGIKAFLFNSKIFMSSCFLV